MIAGEEPFGTAEPVAQRLTGDVAVVTGAAGGIGRAVVRRLAAEGAAVAALDRNAEGCGSVCALVTEAGGTARAYTTEITDRGQVSAVLDRIADDFGTPTILVNNARVGRPASFLETSDDDWARIISVNLTGAFIVAQETARRMVPRRLGRIVNVASLAAHTANQRQAAYAASKGGLVALTRVMAFELAPFGISVNAISPGPIDTELAAAMLTEQARRAREERIPQGRLGKPEEVAAAIAFLGSPDASYVNGTVLTLDGGLLIAGIRDG